ncbi:MAG: HEPN domain-containing protein [candidate division NC10 bacterium]
MKTPEQVRLELVKAWLAKADQDVLVAGAVLDLAMPSYDPVGFHAQQAAEKALKALLVRHQVRFGKTHDMRGLLDLAERVAPGIGEQLAGVEALTPYAVDARYPGEDPPLGREDASARLDVARRVVAQVRALLQPYLEGERPGG